MFNHCFHTFAIEKERQVFRNRAKLDFSSFLEHRSVEFHPGGILILNALSFDKGGKNWLNEYMDIL